MKYLFLLLLVLTMLQACKNKADMKPTTIDTVIVSPPAAPDTMTLQQRPADSLLKTTR